MHIRSLRFSFLVVACLLSRWSPGCAFCSYVYYLVNPYNSSTECNLKNRTGPYNARISNEIPTRQSKWEGKNTSTKSSDTLKKPPWYVSKDRKERPGEHLSIATVTKLKTKICMSFIYRAASSRSVVLVYATVCVTGKPCLKSYLGVFCPPLIYQKLVLLPCQFPKRQNHTRVVQSELKSL